MPKLIKRIFAFLGTLILLLLIAMVAIPFFYKTEILDYVKTDLNKNINATAEFSDVDLSLFKSFPQLYFSINDLKITGHAPFEGIDLIDSKKVGFSMDLMSVIKKEQTIKIHSVELISPAVNVIVSKDGTANYNILKESALNNIGTEPSAESASTSFDLELEKYVLENATLTYNDKANSLYLKTQNLNHSGKGDFNASNFDLMTKTHVDKLTVSNGGISYLSNDEMNMNLSIGVDTENSIYTIKENDIILNALKLKMNGLIAQKNKGYDLDLKLAAPGNEFKEILSLLPGAYTKEFSSVKANGNFNLAALVKGVYNAAQNQFPNVDLDLTINKGAFQYPGMGSGLKDLFAKLTVAGNIGNVDQLKIDAEKFNFNINGEPFVSNFVLTNLESNPSMDGALKGKIDFGFINQTMPLEGVQKLGGIFDVDMKIDASYQELESGKIDEIKLAGTADITDFVYDAEELPEFSISKAHVDFTPKSVVLNNFDLKYGGSDLKGKGQLDNFLAILLPSKVMVGSFDINSNTLDINQLIGYEENGSATSATTTENQTQPEPTFDRFDFKVKAKIGDMIYDQYPITDFLFDGRIQPNAIAINATKGFLGKSDFAAKGELNNIFEYLYNSGTVKGSLDIGSNSFDLNEYMAADDSDNPQAKTIADSDGYEAIILPERTEIDITAKVKKLTYTDLNFTNFRGKVNIKDQIATLKNCKLNGLGGTMLMDGNYDSSTDSDPQFSFNYGMQKVDFGKVFTQLVSWEKLAPIGKFLTGEFNTTLKFKGTLKDGFYPDLNSLTADGFLQTLDATLKAFTPLEKVANQLNIKEFKSLRIQNTKNWFEVKDGKIEVQDFDYSYKGIDMVVGGFHGLTQDMDYNIVAKIPKEMVEGNQVGQLANQGLGFLAKQANKLGIKMDPGSSLNVRLNIGGSISKPTLKVNILGTDGKTTIKDQVVNTVKETVNNAVDSARTVVTETVDVKKKELQAKMDKEVKLVMNAAEKQAYNIRAAGKKTADQAKQLGYQQADKLVKDAGNNIFKKKAAELAANKIKSETDKKVAKLEQEADKKADQIMNKAKDKVKAIQKKYQDL